MGRLKECLKKVSHKSQWRVVVGSYTKEVGVMGYCQSPKSGRFGVFVNGVGYRQTATFDTEEQAQSILVELLEQDFEDCPNRMPWR